MREFRFTKVESAASAALSSWTFGWFSTGALLAALFIYLRGWIRGRRLLHDPRDLTRLVCYCAGIFLLFVALDSPLDTLDSLFLSAHMAQHLLLMMLAPPLLLLGKPMWPYLRGLPKTFVKEGLGPFLAWPALRRFGGVLTAPPTAWCVFAFSTVFWHLPRFYELAVNSADWHAVQHASFFWSGILFWWPLIRPLPGRSLWPQWIAIPYLLLADLVNTGLSAFFVFSGHSIYPSYRSVDDQTLAGLIMWVPGSIVYLVPAFVFVMRLFSSERMTQTIVPQRMPKRIAKPFPVWWRRVAQAALLLVAAAVMADGFFGKQVTAVNLAGPLPWVYWRGLSIAALLLVGNLFCMACPFMLVRDAGRAVLPARLRWPKALRNKWFSAALFVIFLWAYEAFSLWDSPWLTAWIIAGYFITALLVDGFFKGASFCKYVCPIGQYHFVTSLVSPREIAVKSQAVCQSCKTFDCIRGNETARGCELDLFQPKKIGNLDCTFCLDCVKACPHENVGLVSIIPASTLLVNTYRSSIGRLSKRKDWLALVLLVVFGGFVNAAGMVHPVMMWSRLSLALFVLAGAVAAPVMALALCGLLTKLVAPQLKPIETIARFALLLVPTGAGMWAAHISYHVLAAKPLEIVLLGLGLLVTVYLIWQLASELVSGVLKTIQLAAPWAALALALYAAGLWIVFQPMMMRGMS